MPGSLCVFNSKGRARPSHRASLILSFCFLLGLATRTPAAEAATTNDYRPRRYSAKAAFRQVALRARGGSLVKENLEEGTTSFYHLVGEVVTFRPSRVGESPFYRVTEVVTPDVETVSDTNPLCRIVDTETNLQTAEFCFLLELAQPTLPSLSNHCGIADISTDGKLGALTQEKNILPVAPADRIFRDIASPLAADHDSTGETKNGSMFDQLIAGEPPQVDENNPNGEDEDETQAVVDVNKAVFCTTNVEEDKWRRAKATHDALLFGKKPPLAVADGEENDVGGAAVEPAWRAAYARYLRSQLNAAEEATAGDPSGGFGFASDSIAGIAKYEWGSQGEDEATVRAKHMAQILLKPFLLKTNLLKKRSAEKEKAPGATTRGRLGKLRVAAAFGKFAVQRAAQMQNETPHHVPASLFVAPDVDPRYKLRNLQMREIVGALEYDGPFGGAAADQRQHDLLDHRIKNPDHHDGRAFPRMKLLLHEERRDASTGELLGVAHKFVPATPIENEDVLRHTHAEISPALFHAPEAEVVGLFGAEVVNSFVERDAVAAWERRSEYVRQGYWGERRGFVLSCTMLVALMIYAGGYLVLLSFKLMPLGRDRKPKAAWLREQNAVDELGTHFGERLLTKNVDIIRVLEEELRPASRSSNSSIYSNGPRVTGSGQEVEPCPETLLHREQSGSMLIEDNSSEMRRRRKQIITETDRSEAFAGHVLGGEASPAMSSDAGNSTSAASPSHYSPNMDASSPSSDTRRYSSMAEWNLRQPLPPPEAVPPQKKRKHEPLSGAALAEICRRNRSILIRSRTMSADEPTRSREERRSWCQRPQIVETVNRLDKGGDESYLKELPGQGSGLLSHAALKGLKELTNQNTNRNKGVCGEKGDELRRAALTAYRNNQWGRCRVRGLGKKSLTESDRAVVDDYNMEAQMDDEEGETGDACFFGAGGESECEMRVGRGEMRDVRSQRGRGRRGQSAPSSWREHQSSMLDADDPWDADDWMPDSGEKCSSEEEEAQVWERLGESLEDSRARRNGATDVASEGFTLCFQGGDEEDDEESVSDENASLTLNPFGEETPIVKDGPSAPSVRTPQSLCELPEFSICDQGQQSSRKRDVGGEEGSYVTYSDVGDFLPPDDGRAGGDQFAFGEDKNSFRHGAEEQEKTSFLFELEQETTEMKNGMGSRSGSPSPSRTGRSYSFAEANLCKSVFLGSEGRKQNNDDAEEEFPCSSTDTTPRGRYEVETSSSFGGFHTTPKPFREAATGGQQQQPEPFIYDDSTLLKSSPNNSNVAPHHEDKHKLHYNHGWANSDINMVANVNAPSSAVAAVARHMSSLEDFPCSASDSSPDRGLHLQGNVAPPLEAARPTDLDHTFFYSHHGPASFACTPGVRDLSPALITDQDEQERERLQRLHTVVKASSTASSLPLLPGNLGNNSQEALSNGAATESIGSKETYLTTRKRTDIAASGSGGATSNLVGSDDQGLYIVNYDDETGQAQELHYAKRELQQGVSPSSDQPHVPQEDQEFFEWDSPGGRAMAPSPAKTEQDLDAPSPTANTCSWVKSKKALQLTVATGPGATKTTAAPSQHVPPTASTVSSGLHSCMARSDYFMGATLEGGGGGEMREDHGLDPQENAHDDVETDAVEDAKMGSCSADKDENSHPGTTPNDVVEFPVRAPRLSCRAKAPLMGAPHESDTLLHRSESDPAGLSPARQLSVRGPLRDPLSLEGGDFDNNKDEEPRSPWQLEEHSESSMKNALGESSGAMKDFPSVLHVNIEVAYASSDTPTPNRILGTSSSDCDSSPHGSKSDESEMLSELPFHPAQRGRPEDRCLDPRVRGLIEPLNMDAGNWGAGDEDGVLGGSEGSGKMSSSGGFRQWGNSQIQELSTEEFAKMPFSNLMVGQENRALLRSRSSSEEHQVYVASDSGAPSESSVAESDFLTAKLRPRAGNPDIPELVMVINKRRRMGLNATLQRIGISLRV